MNKKKIIIIIAAVILLICVAVAVAIILKNNSDVTKDPDVSAEDTLDSNTSADTTDNIATNEEGKDIVTDEGPIGDPPHNDTEKTNDSKDSNSVNKDTSAKGAQTIGKDKDSSTKVTEKDTGNKPSSSQQGGNGKDTQTSGPVTKPDDTTANTDNPSTPIEPGPDTSLTYEEYMAMTATQQQAYFESFASIDDYFTWYNDAKKAYEDAQDRVEIDGEIDIGDIIGGN